ncbi:cyclophilin-like fold protein [Spirosoma montaniterrae]|uniref:Cyclophilin-like domain-containing protein n=1 Tax=Spirosoma montaniterrae TaxID=1178516 RepID=A0A1P9X199_9BACT|nr:cyclophilin-like fold protein [Spirosoma montaniterrae]AQG81406.1 hypothetical protein AWR27_20035 [Spirosoma montaniterrae]
MNRSFTLLLPLLLFFVSATACKPTNPTGQDTVGTTNNDKIQMTNRLIIRIEANTFTATLLDNPTVTAFKARLPITLSMRELNGNEKFAELTSVLPTNAANPGTIQTGDLMLYGSNTLVLFYETFRTSYSYTKLGRIDNPAGLAAALGSGNVTITFELE